MSSVKQIDARSVHRICSGQVVSDLGASVKELVENALDAGATSIEVRLKECGSELIEVADNGSGISEQDYQAATLKHHTSKLAQFTDLDELGTLGFRGEALSSLCAICDVSIVTRTASDAAGSRLTYDHEGDLVGRAAAARAVGTTVSLKGLFSTLPVRQQELQRNLRREFTKLVTLLQAYALTAKGVRFHCSNQSGSGARTTVVTTPGQDSLRDHVVAVFGSKAAAGLQPLELQLTPNIRVEGLVSGAGTATGRAAGDRQFFYINGRPVDMPRVSRHINEAYKSLTSPAAAVSKPFAILNWIVPTRSVDVNLTPDKRKVYLHDESSIIKAFKEAINALWDPAVSVHSSQRPMLPAKRASAPAALQPLSNRPRLTEQLNGISAKPCHQDGNSPSQSEQPSPPEPSPPDSATREGHGSNPPENPSPPSDTTAFSEGGSPTVSGPPHSGPLHNSGGGPSPPPSRHATPAFAPASAPARPLRPRSLSNFMAGGSGAAPPASLPSFLQSVLPAAKGSGGGAVQGLLDRINDDENCLPGDAEADRPRHGAHPAAECQPQQPAPSPSDPATAAEQRGSPDSAAAPHGTQRGPADTPGGADGGSAVVWDDEPIRSAMPWDREDVGALGPEHPGMPHVPGRNSLLPDSSQRVGGADGAGAGREGGVEVEDNDGDGRRTSTPLQSAVTVPWTEEAVLEDMQLAAQHAGAAAIEAGGSDGNVQEGDRVAFSFHAAALEGEDDADESELGDREDRSAAELDQNFEKSSFRRMEIIGQFNLGFIIAAVDGALWIVDQHAADEKYNFERLQATTVMNRQPLVCPVNLNLSVIEDMALRDHLETFSKNGFAFREGPDGRLRLSSVPFSQQVTLGPDDVRELLAALEHGTGAGLAMGRAGVATQAVGEPVVRPSKVRAMLASRACRSSIMIGRHLTRAEMKRVVNHLADLYSPWKCPHGRPTLKLLARLPE